MRHFSPTRRTHGAFARGFSLLELMIAVAIVGILGAVMLPSYKSHLVNAKIPDAFNGLGELALKAQQYYLNNKNFYNFNCTTSAPTANYDFYCSLDSTVVSPPLSACPANGGNAAVAANAMLVQTALFCAVGKGDLSGYVYTIDSNGNKTTTQPGASNSTCWLKSQGGSC